MKCIVIAEIGWNFMGDMQLAEKMIKEAKKSGADYAKFQYWNPEKLKCVIEYNGLKFGNKKFSPIYG